MDDCRNTDNAWVETTILNIHLDRTSQVMVDINNMVRTLLFFIVLRICRTSNIFQLHEELGRQTLFPLLLGDNLRQKSGHDSSCSEYVAYIY